MKIKQALLTFIISSATLHAQEADLAKKLANPISDLISLPIQSNHDSSAFPSPAARPSPSPPAFRARKCPEPKPAHCLKPSCDNSNFCKPMHPNQSNYPGTPVGLLGFSAGTASDSP